MDKLRICSYNEEAGSHEHSFQLHVQVQRELDAKVVRVCEDLLQKAAPLLADATNGLVAIFALQLQSEKNKNVLSSIFSCFQKMTNLDWSCSFKEIV